MYTKAGVGWIALAFALFAISAGLLNTAGELTLTLIWGSDVATKCKVAWALGTMIGMLGVAVQGHNDQYGFALWTLIQPYVQPMLERIHALDRAAEKETFDPQIVYNSGL